MNNEVTTKEGIRGWSGEGGRGEKALQQRNALPVFAVHNGSVMLLFATKSDLSSHNGTEQCISSVGERQRPYFFWAVYHCKHSCIALFIVGRAICPP